MFVMLTEKNIRIKNEVAKDFLTEFEIRFVGRTGLCFGLAVGSIGQLELNFA